MGLHSRAYTQDAPVVVAFLLSGLYVIQIELHILPHVWKSCFVATAHGERLNGTVGPTSAL